tara:strand:- start:205 stop:429 length:225 start_codon:yes stop_codon:yes gene_type:complete
MMLMPVAAENSVTSSEDNGKYYVGVYVIIFLAIFGWAFFLTLLGTAIFLAVRQYGGSTKLFSMKSVRKKRVRCK